MEIFWIIVGIISVVILVWVLNSECIYSIRVKIRKVMVVKICGLMWDIFLLMMGERKIVNKLMGVMMMLV